MSLCGQSPLFVPTTVNAQIRNIDAVDIGADTIHCKNLNINGEAVSTILQNIESSGPNDTVFRGTITAGELKITQGATCESVTTTDIDCNGTIYGESIVTSGAVDAISYFGTIATPTQNSITKIGTQTSLDCSGNITQTGGTVSLQATTVAGNLTMSGTSAALSQTGTSATASLKSTTVTSLTSSGNITQSAGTTTLKKTTINGDSTAYLLGAYNSSMTSGTAVWTELGADSSNGLLTQFKKGSDVTANTALLSLSSSSSTGVLNIEYDNINAPKFETNDLTVNGDITQSTGTTTLTGLTCSGSTSLQSTTAASLVVSGTTCTVAGKNVMVSQTGGATSTATSTNIVIGTNHTRIAFQGVVGPLTLATSATAYSGASRTNRGDTTTTWSGNTIQLTSSAVPTTGTSVYGWCDIMRYNATTFLITATLTEYASGFNYTHTTTGTVTTSSLSWTLTRTAGGTIYTTYY